MALLLLFLSLVLAVPAMAQTDTYWQTLYANSQGQCGASLVSLAKQLDDAKKQVEDLQKKLAEKEKTGAK